jgi:hypothetical protein
LPDYINYFLDNTLPGPNSGQRTFNAI